MLRRGQCLLREARSSGLCGSRGTLGAARLRCQGAASFHCLPNVQEQQHHLLQGLCRLMEHAGLVAAKAIAATALLCVAEPCILGAVVQPQLLHQVCLDAQSAADSWIE